MLIQIIVTIFVVEMMEEAGKAVKQSSSQAVKQSSTGSRPKYDSCNNWGIETLNSPPPLRKGQGLQLLA
jgi:hypothetical protein